MGKNKDRPRRSKSLIGSKLRPIDMGKIKDYKGTKMDYASENENDYDMLNEKTHIVIKKKWTLKGMEQINVNLPDTSSDEDNLYSSEDLTPSTAPNTDLRSVKSAFVNARPKRMNFKRGKSMTPTSKSPSVRKTKSVRNMKRQRSTTPKPKSSRNVHSKTYKKKKIKKKKKKIKKRKKRKKSEEDIDEMDDYKKRL